MAETLISPGVLARENDQSFVSATPAPIGAAIVGPTLLGKVNIPKIVTTYSDYLQNFGGYFISGGNTYNYLTALSAYNYFNNGGTSLLVTRVASGSFTPASSSNVSGSTTPVNNIFSLEFLTDGIIGNNSGSEVSGSLPSGSAYNVRWEIQASNTSSGTFTLLIRRGDDTANTPTILETWSNLSLDPNQSNYIEKVIGNQTYNVRTDGTSLYLQVTGSYPVNSKYVRVKAVNQKTPNFFDNTGTANSAFTGSIPAAQSGAFIGGTGENIPVSWPANFYENMGGANIQGINPDNYTSSFAILANKDDYKYNVITAPGLMRAESGHAAAITALINNTQDRGDAIAVIDLVKYGQNIANVTAQAAALNTSYAAAYWPWVQIADPDTQNLVWVPASTIIPGVYAYNDQVAAPWFAPAGINRGGLSQVVLAERRLSSANRDTLYSAKINPIATFPATGVVVFGQKTLQNKASALDRVNVRRLLITLKNTISNISNTLVFEQNTLATRNTFLAQVNPYLESVQQRQGLYAYKVIMDESNNTPDVVDRNQLRGAIYLQPTKTAEFIILDFNILPTGATFPS
jgi:phage tail sheath protein FI